MLNPLVIAGVKQDPTKILRPGIAIAAATSALLARIGIGRVHHDTIAGTMIAHWLSGLMTFIFGIALIVSALERYTDTVERSSEFGLLRIFGASRSYLFSLLMQETAAFAIPGALCGLACAYCTGAVLQLASGGLIAFQIPLLWWPPVAVLSGMGSLCGAVLALPRAVTEGVQQAL